MMGEMVESAGVVGVVAEEGLLGGVCLEVEAELGEILSGDGEACLEVGDAAAGRSSPMLVLPSSTLELGPGLGDESGLEVGGEEGLAGGDDALGDGEALDGEEALGDDTGLGILLLQDLLIQMSLGV